MVRPNCNLSATARLLVKVRDRSPCDDIAVEAACLVRLHPDIGHEMDFGHGHIIEGPKEERHAVVISRSVRVIEVESAHQPETVCDLAPGECRNTERVQILQGPGAARKVVLSDPLECFQADRVLTLLLII